MLENLFVDILMFESQANRFGLVMNGLIGFEQFDKLKQKLELFSSNGSKPVQIQSIQIFVL
jgi:hypothetical protein